MGKMATDSSGHVMPAGKFMIRDKQGRLIEIKGAGSMKGSRLSFQDGVDLTKPIAVQVMRPRAKKAR